MSWLRRLWNALNPGKVGRNIDRELSFHIAERSDQLRAAGMNEREARLAARRQFGNVAAQAESTRDMDITAWVDAFRRNLRYSVRTLAKTPGFTITVLLTLALGIGANSAMFSAVDAILLRPLPYPNPDRLITLAQVQADGHAAAIAPVRLEDWNRLGSSFLSITGYYAEDATETSGELPEQVRRAAVAPRFLEVWGVAPALGRDFTSDERRFGGPTAVLISDRYWRRRFGANPNVVGEQLRVEGFSAPVVGVMPPSFLFPDRDVDLWFPVPADAPYAQDRRETWYIGVGRLQPGLSLGQARANLAAVQAQLGEQYPETDGELGVRLEPLKEATVGGVRGSLWLLFGAVSVLLLIAGANIAALILSRAARRQRDISLRFSLGASRLSVAAQMLTETGVLVFAGAALGLGIAAGAAAVFRSLAGNVPRIGEVALDGRLVLYTLASSVAVALLCGLVPAIRGVRGGVAQALADRRASVSNRNSIQWVLVAVQVALSVTLLSGAGLLFRSFQELSRVSPGFDAGRVLTFRLSGGYNETADYPAVIQRVNRTLVALSAVPGVESAAAAAFLPGLPGRYDMEFELARGRADSEPDMIVESRPVSAGYFATLGIPLLSGELCQPAERLESMDVMVNSSFANRYLGGASGVGEDLIGPVSAVAVGQSLVGDVSAMRGRVLGIVGDVRERGLDREPVPTVYPCFSASGPAPFFLVLTNASPTALTETIRREMLELEPLRSVYDIALLDRRIDDAFLENRARTVLLAFFAVTALSLACIGLYGTLSYVVSLRRREVGLRLALGAVRRDIVKQFLVKGLRVVGLACALGLALSVAFTRVLSGMLHGVSPSDPATLAAVTMLVLVVAVLASLVPSLRAAFVEPMQALRDE